MPEKMSLFQRIKYLFEYAALRLVVWIIRCLPINWSSHIAGTLWSRFSSSNRRHALAIRQLQAAFPEKTEQECKIIAQNVFYNLGCVFVETIQMDRILADPNRLELIGAEIVEKIKSEGHGLIAVSMHSGNWEISTAFLHHLGLQTFATYQKIHNPYVDAYSRTLRAPLYPAGLLPKSTEAARKAIRHVRNGGAVAILADLREHAGIEIPFFNRPAPSTTFPATLAHLTKAPIIIGRVLRLDNAYFRFEIVEFKYTLTDDRDHDIHAITAKINAQFESWIREYPDQWMWGHRRWHRNDK